VGWWGDEPDILQFTPQIKIATCHYVNCRNRQTFHSLAVTAFFMPAGLSNGRGLDCTQKEYLFVVFL